MKIEIQITGEDLNERHEGYWDFILIRDGVPGAGSGGETLGETIVLAIVAAQAAGINVGGPK